MINKFTTLPLGNSEAVAIIDKSELQRCNKYLWWKHNKGYVAGRVDGKLVLLHRFILNFPNSQIDHKNRNKLDCRKDNLRLCTQGQNMANGGKRKNGKDSKYRGVTLHRGRWRATISYESKQQYLGHFNTEIEAAIAYDEASKVFFGEFAGVNFTGGNL